MRLKKLRKLHKEQLKELLVTLEEANAELFNPENKPLLSTLKTDITDFIRSIILYINANVSDADNAKNEAVTALNAYINSLEDLKNHDRLNQQIQNIKEILSNIKPDNFETLFIIDSGAKSDAMLPIYKIAKADPNCIARWMPVPLFGLDNNGAITDIKFDGEEFYKTKGIECTNWRTYDIKKAHPDVIFTDNIYDDDNLITQIPPKFWTNHLKGYTDFLVYVHYGLDNSILINPDLTDWEKNYEENNRIFLLNGQLDVNYYITQSQETANTLISMWNFAFKKFDLRKPVGFDEKFLPLGSPKLDVIHELPTTDYPLPEDWQNKIYDAEGNKKTVILYASTIRDFLADIDVWLKKLEIIIEFIKNQEDVVCIFRMHPLTLQTIKASRSDYVYKYNHLLKIIPENENLILDETPDFHTAFKVSDCYFGEHSSLLSLYLATGKPFGFTAYKGYKWFAPVKSEDTTFNRILDWQINNLKKTSGGNIFKTNYCIWWNNFCDNNQTETFLKLFIHYVKFQDKYPQTDEYKRLKREMLEKYYTNSDGTASKKIYEFFKLKVLQ
jgi:hypothetical protein